MDYIINRMQVSLMLDEHLNDQYNLLKYHQARTEYYLVLILGYLWNKNINTDKIASKDKLQISNKIGSRNFTIGSLIKVIEALDVENEIIYDINVKRLFEHYRNTRNEEIGHGFNFSDASNELIEEFEEMHNSFSGLDTFIFSENFDLILVKQEDGKSYRGINLKYNGSVEVWSCQKSNIINLFPNELYLQHSHQGQFSYFRLSPFIGIERETGTTINYYIFNKINNLYTGCVTYNFISKTGKKTDLEWPELANLDIITDGQIKVSKNGTTINIFEPNYHQFINVGVTKEAVRDFLINNKASVCANLWGHGGVGKTATIQKVCEELISSKQKQFKYILFLSAKNTLFNTETGLTEEISEENRVDDFESLLKTINSIVFRDSGSDLSAIKDKIINYNEGKILIVVDDYESFNNIEKEKVIKFIGLLNIQYHKAIITTRSTVEIEGSKPIPIDELDIKSTVHFFKELLNREKKVPEIKRVRIAELLKTKENREALFNITDGRPLFITYFANILTRIEFEEALNQDIKSSKSAINFLFGKLFNYLSVNAKLIFLSLGQMDKPEDLTYSLSHVRFVSKFDKDEDLKNFNDGMYELEKYKIIKIDDSKLLLRVWAEEILRPMNEAFIEYDDNDFKSVVIQRAKLIKENRKVDTVQEILFQEAEKIRYDGNKNYSAVESAYRRVINSKDSNADLKLQSIERLANYFISEGKRERAIKVYSDFELEFSANADFIKKFAYICYGSKERRHRNKSIQVLLDFINDKKHRRKLSDSLRLEFFGLVVMRKMTFSHEDIEREKNKMLVGRIDEKDFNKKVVDYFNQLKNIFKQEGKLLFNGTQNIEIERLSKSEKHYIFNGLYHYVEVCIKLQQFPRALNVCNFIFSNAPEHFHNQFRSYLKRIPKHYKKTGLNDLKAIVYEDEQLTEDVVNCEVKEIRSKVVFVRIKKSGKTGSVFIDEMSSKFVKDPNILFRKNQEINLVKIGTDPHGNTSLSLKRMEEKLYEGQIVKCKIIEIFEKKVLVKLLEENLLGEIYIKYISNKFINDISTEVNLREIKYAEIISVHKKYGVGLSLLNVPQKDDDYFSELGMKLKKVFLFE